MRRSVEYMSGTAGTWVHLQVAGTCGLTVAALDCVCPEDEEEECPLTLEKISENHSEFVVDRVPFPEAPCATVARLPCNHRFNFFALVTSWMFGKMQCPMCKAGCDSRLDPESIDMPWAQKLGSIVSERNRVAMLRDIEEETQTIVQEMGGLDTGFVLELTRIANGVPQVINFGSAPQRPGWRNTETFLHIDIPPWVLDHSRQAVENGNNGSVLRQEVNARPQGVHDMIGVWPNGPAWPDGLHTMIDEMIWRTAQDDEPPELPIDIDYNERMPPLGVGRDLVSTYVNLEMKCLLYMYNGPGHSTLPALSREFELKRGVFRREMNCIEYGMKQQDLRQASRDMQEHGITSMRLVVFYFIFGSFHRMCVSQRIELLREGGVERYTLQSGRGAFDVEHLSLVLDNEAAGLARLRYVVDVDDLADPAA